MNKSIQSDGGPVPSSPVGVYACLFMGFVGRNQHGLAASEVARKLKMFSVKTFGPVTFQTPDWHNKLANLRDKIPLVLRDLAC